MGSTMAVSMAAVMSVLVMFLALVMSSLIRVVEVQRNDPDRLTQTEFKMKLLTNECVAKSYTLFIAQ